MDNNNEVFVPPNIIYNKPLNFAINNVDFSNKTLVSKKASFMEQGKLCIRNQMQRRKQIKVNSQ